MYQWLRASCTLRLRSGQALVAVMDWHSRYVLAWQLSNTLDSLFRQVTLQQALARNSAIFHAAYSFTAIQLAKLA